jgi:hypothetical protein
MTGGRRRLLLVSSTLLVLLCVGGATFALQSGSPERKAFVDGPLYTDNVDIVTLQRPVGGRFSYGIAVLFNPSPEPLILESASFYRPTPGLQLLGSFLLGPRRYLWAFSSDSGPVATQPMIVKARVPLRRLGGYGLQPDSIGKPGFGAELILFAQTTRPGRFQTEGIVVSYRFHGKHYRELLPRVLVVCAPPRKVPRSCSEGTPAPIPAAGSVRNG